MSNLANIYENIPLPTFESDFLKYNLTTKINISEYL